MIYDLNNQEERNLYAMSKEEKFKQLLVQLNEQAQELIDLGDSKEKAQGYGMQSVTKAVSESLYPFSEGDEYFTIEDGDIVRSCWDDISEEFYTPSIKRKNLSPL